MLTGKQDVDIARRCLDAGAATYLTKPFDPDALRNEVRRLMEPAPKPADGQEAPPWRVLD